MSTPRFNEKDAPKRLPGLQAKSDGLRVLSEYEAEHGGIAAEKQERHADDALAVRAREDASSARDKTAAAIQKEEGELPWKKND